MKKVTSIIMAAAVAVCCCTFNVSAEKQKENDIVVLYTNDVHCGITDFIGYDGLALYKREMEAEHEHVLLVDAGDAIQGGSMCTLTDGAYITELMNTLHYDAVTLGNHEFDYSIPTLMQRAVELDCGYICCNFKDLETNETVFKPYKIIDLGETQVAFVGASTPETLSSARPVYFQNDDDEYVYSFGEHETDLYDTIQKNVDKVRQEGADYVILLAHLGENNVFEKWSAPTVAKYTDGIDVIIDGHSHETTSELIVKNKNNDDVIISQTGTKLANIGKLTISADGNIKTELVGTVPRPDDDSGIAGDSWKEVPDRQAAFVDTAVNDKINELQSSLEDVINKVIGYADFTLYDRDPETGERRVRNAETNLGDLVADSVRYCYNTDIGLMNGGGLRASVPEGDITYGIMLDVLPYSNMLCSVKATGQQILDFLEYSSMFYPDESGSFLSVSGLEYTIDKGIKSTVMVDDFGNFAGVTGEYRVKDVLVGGKPLDPDKTYTVSSIDYLLKDGGDGFILSGKSEIYKDTQALDIDVLSEFLTEYFGGTIPEKYRAPEGQGRIKFIDSSLTPDKPEESSQESSGNEESGSEVSSPESSGPEISVPEGSGTSQEESVKTDVKDPSAETGTPETGDAPFAAACAAVIVSVSAIVVLASRRKEEE